MTPNGNIAAIFDLDKTLLSGTTGTMVITWLRRSGRLGEFMPRRQMPGVALSMALFRLGLIDATRAMQIMARTARGKSVAAMWAMVDDWFVQMVVHTVTPGATERVAWHMDAGHLPIICTASSQFSAMPVARHLGIEHALYSEWQHQGGVMTGGLRLPIVYGNGKVHWLRRWAAEQRIELGASYFYTDHISDLPLLELVGHPAAVNPDPDLRALAEARGWPVYMWY